jgi:diguanylate cyclase (GGDEF)-like protein/PAS domain S-box-containing protein
MSRLYSCITEQHDLLLVALAAVICSLGAYATVVLLHAARDSGPGLRLRWIGATAVTAATATWATHFIAMLAFKPGVAATYDPTITLVSLALPMLLSACALAAMVRWQATLPVLAAGALVGIGIAGMHYVGMAAYYVQGSLLWDMPAVVDSVLAGTFLTAASFLAAIRSHRLGRRIGSAALLTLSICVLHFLGMAAIVVLPDLDAQAPDSAISAGTLAIAVAAGAGLVVLLSLGAVELVRRERRRDREEATRMRILVDATVEGLLVCDGDTIVAANRSIANLAGRDDAWLVNRPLTDLLPDLSPATTAGDDAQACEETELTAASGEVIPVEVVTRPIVYGGKPRRVLALRDLRDRRRAEERIRFLAHHDPLTQLPNRTGFAEHLGRAIQQREHNPEPFALLALDLDRFKLVNDTLGHAMGDALLVKVAARLRASVREDDLVCRLGGDEFAIVQFARRQPEAATALAARVIELLSRPFIVHGQVLNIGVSVGIALYPSDGRDIASLARNADLALYRSKDEGRGTYRFFETEMDTRMQRRRLLEVELRTALALRQFHLLYQPQLCMQTGLIIGFEALIRWQHPKRGVISPAEFIPLAEETGLIIPIGEWVLREACREAASWDSTASIAINLSPVQFRSPGLVEAVRSACLGARLDPARLELEVTESVLLNDNEATLETLRALKQFGARISMDDFGTGYSSLSYLRSFPFDKIKIDRSFVRDITEASDTAAIVRAIIGLGKSLGMETTVEGVETAEQLALLRREGCDQAQGYFIGRPLPPDAAQDLLMQERVA